MLIKKWSKLPENLQNDNVIHYYNILRKRRFSLFIKRVFDLFNALLLLLILLPFMIIIAIAIKIDSKGPIFYRQERITKYGKVFRIHKFRSMKVGADKGSLLTSNNDDRVTKVGKVIRKLHLDEVPQLIDILKGDMTFVGTRPEVKKYVDCYTPEMMASLLMPAGLTSRASYKYKDENSLIDSAEDADKVYLEVILPEKMKYNLEYIEKFHWYKDIVILFETFVEVFFK